MQTGLRRPLLALLQLVSLSPLAAQLRLDTDSTELAAWISLAGARLQHASPTDSEQLARLVIARLRLGDAAGAAAALDRAGTVAERDSVWEIVMHAAFLRATGDATRARAQFAGLDRRLQAVEQGSAPRSYAEGALRVHARYCLGLLADAVSGSGPHAPGAVHARRATAALLALEQDTWQPGRGHFRPTARGGELAMPEPAEPSLLVPCSAGMVLATGERMLRHLHGVLAAAATNDPQRWRSESDGTSDTPLFLAAATTLGDGAHREAAWLRPWPDPATDPRKLAMHVDALLFAVTGMRIAVGGGSDPGWLRMAPWLPPGTSRLSLHGLLANGRRLDLDLEAETGELRVRLRLDGPDGLGPLRTAVCGSTRQVVTELRAGEPFECRLPVP